MKRNNIPLNFTEKYKNRASLAASIITLLLLCLLVHSVDRGFADTQRKREEAEIHRQEEEAKKQAEDASATTANILVAGDNFYGESLLDSGKSDSGAWNYEGIYSELREKISAADLAVVHQPTILTTDHDMVSGTDSYATPTEVGDALASAGFDVIASAASHSDDYGVDYINRTLNFWKTSHPDLTVAGLHESQDDADSLCIRQVNGINIAFLSYAFGSYYDALPEENAYMIDYFVKDKVTSDIQKARGNSDCIILLAQWGTQGNAVPSEYERQWANYLMTQGVNVIVGAYPHVLQPCQTLSDDEGHETLVYYSLGNFVTDSENAPELLGALAEFTLEKRIVDGQPQVKVLSSTLTPTVMHYNRGEGLYQPMLLANYTDELAASHTVRSSGADSFSPAALQQLFNYITGLSTAPASDSDLLDMTCNADGSMTGKDGTTVSAEELASRYPADTSGSLDALSAILAGTPVSSENTSDTDTGTGEGDAADSEADSGDDSDYDSGYDSSYDSGDGSNYDSSYDSGEDSDYDSSYDSGEDSDYDSGYDSEDDSDYDSSYDSGYDQEG